MIEEIENVFFGKLSLLFKTIPTNMQSLTFSAYHLSIPASKTQNETVKKIFTSSRYWLRQWLNKWGRQFWSHYCLNFKWNQPIIIFLGNNISKGLDGRKGINENVDKALLLFTMKETVDWDLAAKVLAGSFEKKISLISKFDHR